MNTIINFKAKSLRTLVDPILGKNNNQNKESWVCYVDLNDLPEQLQVWMEVNPREQNLETKVSRTIKKSIDYSKNFHDLNRGLVILLKELKAVKLDDNNYDVWITLTDQAKHGLVDGGHTFKCILEKRNSYLENNNKLSLNFVSLQMIKGIEDVVELAAARNTSFEVDTKSIAELEKKFDDVKNILKNSKYYFLLNRITFKQFEKISISDHAIDAREIIALLALFHPKINVNHKEKSDFIQVYTSKAWILEQYLIMINKKQNIDEVKKMSDVLPKIIELWEEIECSIPSKAGKVKYKLKKYANTEKDENDKYQKVNKTLFERTPTYAAVPKGLIYPVIAAFAQLIKFNKNVNKYNFEFDPLVVWKYTSEKIINKLMESSKRNADSPNLIGKDTALWDSLFKEVLIDIKIDNKKTYSSLNNSVAFNNFSEKKLEVGDK